MRNKKAASILALAVATACVREQRAVVSEHEPIVTCVSGYFEGTVTSQGSSTDALGLNLVCSGATYQGDLFAPFGRSRVLGAKRQGTQLKIDVGEDRPVGSLEGAFDGKRLKGRFQYGEEAGAFDLERVGPSRPAPHLDLTTAAWREDVAFFARELPRRHANAFSSLPQDRFDAEIAALLRELPELDGDGVFVRLMRVANLVGDGHTQLLFPKDPPTFPLRLQRFGAHYRVVAVARGAERALGARVVSIDGRPIAEVRDPLWPLSPAGETPELRELRVTRYLSNGLLLHGARVIADRNSARYSLIDEDGNAFTQAVRGGPPGDYGSWERIPRSPPLSEQRPDVPFWFSYLSQFKATYVSFRGYDGLGENARTLFAALERDRPDKLIIDLRNNGGGDNTEGLKHLVEPVRRLESINKPGHLYVLIGVATFSAAMNNAAHFRERTKASLVGETIGERPNSYQEPREVKLPNSGLILRVSTQYYAFVRDGENVIRPDRTIVPTWAEFKNGLDPVLEWVLAAPLR